MAIICKVCGSNDSRVIDSRETQDGIYRRRECVCSERFSTIELVWQCKTGRRKKGYCNLTPLPSPPEE